MVESSVSSAAPSLGRHDRLARVAASSTTVISFAGGLPDPALFPKRELGAALAAVLQSDPSSALQYGWPEGSEQLRSEVASELRARGADIDARRVIITSGAQQAILLSLASAPKCRTIAVDAESYPGALDAFRATSASLTSMRERADLYYVMPSVSNPRGTRMTADERDSLLQRASRHRGYILEDDAYDGTAFAEGPSRPLVADLPDRVFHIGTFSKTLCPGLRIGWLVPPSRIARKALVIKRNQDLQANGIAQALLVEYLAHGHFAELKRHARARYQRKAKRLMASVRRHLPQFSFQAPMGGFSLWLESALKADGERLLEASIRRGAAFDPGSMFRAKPQQNLAIRLCFSAVPESDIDEGVARLARAFGDCR
jgi:2-aminoadipate transaminase